MTEHKTESSHWQWAIMVCNGLEKWLNRCQLDRHGRVYCNTNWWGNRCSFMMSDISVDFFPRLIWRFFVVMATFCTVSKSNTLRLWRRERLSNWITNLVESITSNYFSKLDNEITSCNCLRNTSKNGGNFISLVCFFFNQNLKTQFLFALQNGCRNIRNNTMNTLNHRKTCRRRYGLNIVAT